LDESSFGAPAVPTVLPPEAQRMMESGALLVDVRELDEYQQVRIPGATFMPLSGLAQTYHQLPTDRPVILYCRTGSRSANATAALTHQVGLGNVHNLEGGIVEWYEEGLPTTTEHVEVPVGIVPFDIIEPDVAYKAMENDELRWAVDVRPASQYATGHVPGAVNISFESLPLRYAELPRGEQVLVTCDRGEVSRLAARLLIDLDFQSVAILDGGIEAWRYRDLPLHEER
jgi:rhodanese-related sulfurtransferase